ncbi:hypothetical protein ASPZODRAFT_142276 [Penicilliopsis zonata CBS 506.65]|uniref:Uncharacterized protein n=1 Tax=Penicilliopsis zonata CBS 506.65 TaxID=1073090 RepID=A0A1L9SGZ5_9EURO|nr:hypothetical protein ASPZODRAFT_142276 [Penicilliopsis zonata CBS 506.65]OJJ46462.1 hypothetical protein ASPZODRAFT_142276 [Penicilliopsis zonata CBS 506.65]
MLSSLRQSTLTYSVSSSFLHSASFRLINPRHHQIGTDCVSQTLPASKVAGLDDEQLLARFTAGFFCGAVFSFERWLLWSGNGKILPVGYTGKQTSYCLFSTAVLMKGFNKPQTAIWKASEIPNTHLLPIGTRLFGSFLLVDKHISEDADQPSYVDYGFGSDTSGFSGCHRMQVSRIQGTDSSEEALLEIDWFTMGNDYR